jgi:hypothetical protein
MRNRNFLSAPAAVILALVLCMASATVALADGIQGDTDALATSAPSANGLDATQSAGSTIQYDYSAFIMNTGTAANDVFVGGGDTVTASIAVTQNDLGWATSLSASSFSFTAYGQNMAGTLSVTVPSGTGSGVLNHIKLTISAAASNGETMSPASVVLNYNITTPADQGCTASYSATFLAPFDGVYPGSNLITNTMKNGRTVPVKVTIIDSCTNSPVTNLTGEAVSILVAKAPATSSTSPTDPVESYADAGTSNNGGNQFRWADGFWVYNLDSKGLGLTTDNCYRVSIYVNTTLASGYALLKPVK